ncbi:MAG TPA: diguanylate cyclase, partial [Novosphingobium sp.]|nr:diguanylate cyclase [Novosphingobium sp.]
MIFAPGRSRHMGLIRPAPAALLGMALVVLAALAALTIMQTLQFDEMARQMQQHSARQGFRNRLDALADTLFQRLDGENEAQHFAPRPDASWISTQIAAPLAETAGIEALLVLPEGQDRPTYAAREGARMRHASAGELGPVMLQVARHMRAAPGLMRACSIGWSSGQLMMLCGLRVTSPGRPGTVLVMGAQALDARQLARFGLRSMVGALRVEPASPLDGHQSVVTPAIALEDIDGHAVARLTWQQRRPGADLLERLSWPLAAMALLLGTLATLLTREGLRCLRASKEREHKLAHFDPLTQLPNRSYLLDQLAQVQALARRTPIEVSVLSIDLDRFQDVNDTLGHHAGDALIEAVAKMLQGMCRQSDLLARVGGDEFAVLLPHTGADGALHMAERILSTLASPVDLPCGVLRTGCSIGISCLQDAATTPAEMLRQADLALHEAKERGRGRAAFFEVEMDNALRLRRDLEHDLAAALAGGALRMLYQPQVNTEGHLVGLEALVRWTHPVRGPI